MYQCIRTCQRETKGKVCVGLGVRFDPGVVEAPVGVLGDLLDELADFSEGARSFTS